MIDTVKCPKCGHAENSHKKLFSNLTCSSCKERFSFAYNMYTANYQVYNRASSQKTTTNVRQFLYIIERGRCHYCKQPVNFNKTTIDHIVPVSKNGGNHLHNMVLSCQTCNGLKRDIDYDVFVNNWRYQPNKKTRKQNKRRWLYKLISWYTTVCVLLTKFTVR